MSLNGVNTVEDADMAECEDGEKVVTMMDVLQEQQEFEDDANAVLGASDDKNCTYSKGYIKRQAIYACLTCCADAKDDPLKRAGVCLACSLNCHENHELIELYTKRNFRCDCGNPKFSNPCQFVPVKPDLNEDNSYNQNFSGIYCTCHKPYPDPEAPFEDEMIQCIICEDWLHASHLETVLPSNEQYAEMICKSCMVVNEFLHDYSDIAVNTDSVEIDVVTVNNTDTSMANVSSECNGISEKGSEVMEPRKQNEDIIRGPDIVMAEADNSIKQSDSGEKAETENTIGIEKSEIVAQDEVSTNEHLVDDKVMDENVESESHKNELPDDPGVEPTETEDIPEKKDLVEDSGSSIEKADDCSEKKDLTVDTCSNSDNASKKAADDCSEKKDLTVDTCPNNDNASEKTADDCSEKKDLTVDTCPNNDNASEKTADDCSEKKDLTVDTCPNNDNASEKTADDCSEKKDFTVDTCPNNDNASEKTADDCSEKKDLTVDTCPDNDNASEKTDESSENKEPTLDSSANDDIPRETKDEQIDNKSDEPTTQGQNKLDTEEQSNENSIIESIEKLESELGNVEQKEKSEETQNETSAEGKATENNEQNANESKLDKIESIETDEDSINALEKSNLKYADSNQVDKQENKDKVEDVEMSETKGSEDDINNCSSKVVETVENNAGNENLSMPSEPEAKIEENTKDNKRKLSTEETEDVTSKKVKIESTGCIRPKGVKRRFKGATFWPSNFRQKLCTCNECISMYKDLAVLFLTDPEDTVTAYEVLGKEKTNGTAASQYEKGLEALSSLDRIQQINALTEYNKMRDKLLDFLKSFKDRKEIVKEDDIKAFFAGMKPKREPDGVYFCR